MNSTKSLPIVHITNVQKSFGDIKAVNGVTLDIDKGGFFSLLGPSGCGKTTLLRLIAGFEKPDQGQIEIDGRDMESVEPNLRPTNMVFQSYAIFPHLNVQENVGYGLKKRNFSKKEKVSMVNEILKLVGLDGLNQRSASALSGGQRQRVALARALILKPKVLLLDEPLSALDKKLREQMQIELRQLQRAVGISFILVTHDQEEALTMSDTIAVMFDGKVEQQASPQDLYDRPISKRVASFIGDMNFIKVNVTSKTKDSITLKSSALGELRLSQRQFAQEPDLGETEIGIRPEMFNILDTKDKTEIQEFAKAEIAEMEFFGSSTQYKVRLFSNKDFLLISEKNSFGKSKRKLGDSVKITWNKGAFVGFN